MMLVFREQLTSGNNLSAGFPVSVLVSDSLTGTWSNVVERILHLQQLQSVLAPNFDIAEARSTGE